MYELSHSGGSWRQSLLYSFTGGLDGGQLYGVRVSTLPATCMVRRFGEAIRMRECLGSSPTNGTWQELCCIVFMAAALTEHFPVPSVILHNGIVFGGSPLEYF